MPKLCDEKKARVEAKLHQYSRRVKCNCLPADVFANAAAKDVARKKKRKEKGMRGIVTTATMTYVQALTTTSVEDTPSAPAVPNQPRAVPPLLVQPLAVQSDTRPSALGSRAVHQIEIAAHGTPARRAQTASPSQLRVVEHLVLQWRGGVGTAAA